MWQRAEWIGAEEMSDREKQEKVGSSATLKFTVVTVVINGEKVIRKTITSVLQQTFLPYEYLIIDGKSEDKTVEIAESFAPVFAEKGVKYLVLSEKDTGVFNAMNKGIDLATGNFISFLNAGDWYELDALAKIRSFYSEEPFDLVYGGIHYINEDGKVVNKMSRLDHCPVSSRNWNHPSMFLKKELYLKHRFDEHMRCYADFKIYLALRRSDVKTRIINEIVANYVAGGASNTPDVGAALMRAEEKYQAYIDNGYSWLYWFEAYGWEFLKYVYMRWHRAKARVSS